MKGLFDRVSRKSRRPSRALVVLVVVMSAALALAWPARGRARQDCGVDFVVNTTATTPNGSVDCSTAQYKAGNLAMQNLQSTAAATCPASCPTPVTDMPPTVTSNTCWLSGGRWYATATAQGAYHCE